MEWSCKWMYCFYESGKSVIMQAKSVCECLCPDTTSLVCLDILQNQGETSCFRPTKHEQRTVTMIICDLKMTALHKYNRLWLKTNQPNSKCLYWTGTQKQFFEMLVTGGWDIANKLTTTWLMGKSHLVRCDWLKNVWIYDWEKFPQSTCVSDTWCCQWGS